MRLPQPVTAALAAAGGALAALHGGPAIAALVIAATLLHGLLRGAGPLLFAVPAALCAIPAPANEISTIDAGMHHITARVVAGPFDLQRGRLAYNVHDGFGPALLVSDDLRLRPGDLLQGLARADGVTEDGRPVFQTRANAVHVTPGKTSPSRLVIDLRMAARERLLELVPGRLGPLLCYLVLGRGPTVDSGIAAAHRATGLTHLLAVSGAHASLLAAMLGVVHAGITGRRALSTARSRIVCALLLLLYGAVTGMDPPVFRAVVAFGLWLWVRGHGRRLPAMTALAGPALLTALTRPEDLTGVSFCLSYAAVYGLVLAGIDQAWERRSGTRFRRLVTVPLMASVWATVTTTPWTLWFFGQCTPWTILATPVLGPLVGVMLCLGLLVLLLPPLAHLLTPLLTGLAEVYVHAVEAIATLPAAPIHALASPDPTVLVALAAIGILWCWLHPRRRTVAAACLLVSIPHFLPPAAGPMRLVLLPVGHGQACLVHHPEGVTLVDCGSLGDPQRAARQVIAALVPRRRIDRLILTHGDSDHHLGVPHLLQRAPVGEAWLPDSMRGSVVHGQLVAKGVPVAFVAPGNEVELGAMMLHLPRTTSGRENDRSLWVKVRFAGFTAWLTGDAEEDGTTSFLAETSDPRADLLLLPHHGRKNAQADRLLQAVGPRLALVSDSPRDPMPSQEPIARARGIPVLRTGLVGTITILDGNPPTYVTSRPRNF